MEISSTDCPDSAVLGEIDALVRLVRASCPACPGFPGSEEAERTWLLRDDRSRLLAFLAVCRPDADNLSECVGITRPEARRKGCMRSLLDAASPLLDDRDVLFSCDGGDKETKNALLAIGAEPAGPDQYLMGMDLAAGIAEKTEPERDSEHAIPLSPAGYRPALRMLRTAEEQPGGVRTLRYRFSREDFSGEGFSGESSGQPDAASCRADLLPNGTASFGEFLVAESLRGKGIGANAFARVLRDLRASGAARVILHTDSGNIPAVRLYKKAGFRILETLSIYSW
jgi:GNAT superfamily N-acetyltransferase